MKYGYARVSTIKQGKDGNSLEAQKKALLEAGAEEVFEEAYTGTKTDRPALQKLLSLIQTGDTLIVCKLDRIARSISQGNALIEQLNNKGVKVHILNLGILDNSPASNLIKNIFFAFAEFERDLIVERTSEGKDIARQKPDYRDGRPIKYSKEQIKLALTLLESNSYKSVSQMTGISESTLYRYKVKHACDIDR